MKRRLIWVSGMVWCLLASATVRGESPPCPDRCLPLGAVRTDFEEPFPGRVSPDGLWTKQRWTWGCQLDPALVTVREGSARLRVTAGGGRCAQVDGTYDVWFYGRYRARMRLSDVAGVVNSLFFYGPGGDGEVDIEYLSRERESRRLHFIVHPNDHAPCGSPTHVCHTLPFDPAAGFHEYGFDLHPDRVDFFVDGENVATLRANIPQRPGTLILNNWAIGDWPGPPPRKTADLWVDWVRYEPFAYCPVCPQCLMITPSGAAQDQERQQQE